MKFKVTDNYGEIHLSREYVWDEDEGIPDAETILEQMEDVYPCNCGAGTESQSYCECDSNFDNGTVTQIESEISKDELKDLLDNWNCHTEDIKKTINTIKFRLGLE